MSKIIKVGNSAAVLIPRSSLTALGMSIGDSVVLATDGLSLVVAQKKHDLSWKPSLARILRRHREPLAALAGM
jgi:antitoxin component of MazEF toxin-antitoxin module